MLLPRTLLGDKSKPRTICPCLSILPDGPTPAFPHQYKTDIPVSVGRLRREKARRCMRIETMRLIHENAHAVEPPSPEPDQHLK